MTQDPDDTLKRKTFELLYKMTKSSNVEVIVDRMIDYMTCINDNHYKTYIAGRCVELAEQFAPSNHWFIQVNALLAKALLKKKKKNLLFSEHGISFILSLSNMLVNRP